MALSYDELTTPPTEDEQLTELLELATLAGFPATAWQDGSVPRSLLEIEKTVLVKLATLIASIGKGGLLDDAAGDWLDLLADSLFDEARVAAVKTQGLATLSCSALAGPYMITAQQLVATNAAGVRFRNTNGGTLASGGTLQLTFEAETAGAAGNIGSGQLTIMLTPLAGVTLANPVVPPGSTWITQAGADEESDDELRERCRAKWATLGTGSTVDSYVFWAREADPSIRRVKVLSHSNAGTPTDGYVTLYVAAENDTVDGDAVTAAQDYIDARHPLCTTVVVIAASVVTIPVTCTLRIRAEDKPAAVPLIMAYLNELSASLDIGDTVYRSAIIEQLMRPDGMINAVLDAPAADVALDIDEIAQFDTPTITWVEV